MDTSTTKRRLPEVFNFTDADVVANRKGELSGNQHKRLWDLRWLWIVATAPALMCSCLACSNLHRLSFDYLVVTGLCIAAALFAGSRLLQTHHDVTDQSVSAASGQVRLTIRTAKDPWGKEYERGYELDVDGRVFKLTKIQYDALTDGANYQIYYVPNSMRIVSVIEA
jgi:hypothetical protein